MTGAHPTKSKTPSSNRAIVLAIVAGAVIWGISALVIPKREPWDATVYWAVFYPLGIVAAAGLSLFDPSRPVLLALLVYETQFVGMNIRAGELSNLWPLGMAMFAVMAVPAMIAAKLAARFSPAASDKDED